MPDAPPPQDDFWSLLDEAEETVRTWPEWQRRYELAVFAAASPLEKTPQSD